MSSIWLRFMFGSSCEPCNGAPHSWVRLLAVPPPETEDPGWKKIGFEATFSRSVTFAAPCSPEQELIKYPAGPYENMLQGMISYNLDL